MPRPIYRWKSFWLGVLVLAFIGWAWTRSGEKRDGVSVLVSYWNVRLTNVDGCAVIYVRRFPSKWGFSWNPLHTTATGVWFPPAYRSSQFFGHQIAHWLLTLLFLIPWTALLAWRWRKQRILTKSHDTATAS